MVTSLLNFLCLFRPHFSFEFKIYSISSSFAGEPITRLAKEVDGLPLYNIVLSCFERLRDNVLARSFGRMIRRKVSAYQIEQLQLPLSSLEILEMFPG